MARTFRTEKPSDFRRYKNVSDMGAGSGPLLARLSKRGWHNYSKQFFELCEDWTQLPQLNNILDGNISTAGGNTYADSAINAAMLATNLTNRNFEVLGTNAVSADVTFRTGGGILLTTHATTNDSTIIVPHLNTNQTAWNVASWLTQKQPRFEATFETHTAMTAQTWWYGGKLSNTPVIATDDDQIMFRYDSTSTLGASFLHVITSRAGVDVDDILSLAPALTTQYTLACELDDLMKPHIYINGKDYTLELSSAGQAPLVTAKSLKIYAGILQTSTGTKTLGILPGYRVGRSNA